METKLNRKFRIIIESFDSSLLNSASAMINECLKDLEIKAIGPIYLPTKKKIYCVLRSTHVNKDAREHLEIRIYKRIMDVYPTNWKTMGNIVNLDLPAGVKATIK
jgi:small subunit ribosomal protein S10|tara:strand:+ start:3832 stop:4146 length:315 start_codon:yes stop_codon:yes gene_type:complete